MKYWTASAAVGAVVCAAAGPAQAEISANVAFTSDYVWRGVSQTDEDPAIQGGFDFSHESGFYAGVWGSNVDFDETAEDDADMEFDAYAGFGGDVGTTGIAWDVGVIRYIYPGTSVDFDWTEVYLGVSYAAFSASVNYSNDVFGSDEDGIYYTAGVDWPLAEGFTLSGSVGFYDFDEGVNGAGNPDSYMDYRLGVSTGYAGFGFDLSYHGTNGDGEDLYGDWADDRVVLSIAKEL